MGDSGKGQLHERSKEEENKAPGLHITSSFQAAAGNILLTTGSEEMMNLSCSGTLYSLIPQHLQNPLMGAELSGQTKFEVNYPKSATTTSKLISPEKRARKRANDRVYRQKQKKGKEEMKYNLETLTKEKGALTQENASLKSENEIVKYTVKSQAKVIDGLKSDLDELRSGYGKQNVLIQVLSQQLANYPDVQEENQKLKVENEMLRQVAYMSVDEKMSPVAEEMGKLVQENRRLKVQNNALCERLISAQTPVTVSKTMSDDRTDTATLIDQTMTF